MASCFFCVVVIFHSTSSPFWGSRFYYLRNCSSLRANSAHTTPVSKLGTLERKRLI